MLRCPRLLLGTAAVIFFANFAHIASAAQLTDIEGSQNETAIQWLYERKIVSGYADGTFRPNNNISRGELIAILTKAKNVSPDPAQYKDCFSDLKGHWAEPWVCYAEEQHWIEGYANNTFQPNQYVTKEEAHKMLLTSQGFSVQKKTATTPQLFDDVHSTMWAYPFIYTAKEKGILEEQNGTYGIGAFIPRQGISENLYRALIVNTYNLAKFPEDQNNQVHNENSPINSACDAALQEFGNIQVNKGEMKTIPIKTCKGYRYTACTQNPLGDPHLYGDNESPTASKYGQKSTNSYLNQTNEDGTITRTPTPDCITFEPQESLYYLGIYGAEPNSSANIWISSSKIGYIPPGFENSLTWFSDSCTTLTNHTYGPFNTPWGNEEDLDRPFFEGYPNYLHAGTDYACPANSIVKAMCDGIIVDSNDAGDGWGWHTVLECKKGESTISLAYIHLQQESVLPIGTSVKTGDVIGKVFALKVRGEQEHVHITACQKSHTECEAAGFQPERGASRRTEWWDANKYWFDIDWQTNPGLYKFLPTSNTSTVPKG